MTMVVCRDIEGWKAISRLREFDTTPCVEEGIITFGLLAAVLLLSTLKSFSFFLFNEPLERTHKSILFLRAKLVRLTCHFTVSNKQLITMIGHACCRIYGQLRQRVPCPAVAQINSRSSILYLRALCICIRVRLHLLQPHSHAILFDCLASFLAFVHRRNGSLVPNASSQASPPRLDTFYSQACHARGWGDLLCS
jgi:hypothetical protein